MGLYGIAPCCTWELYKYFSKNNLSALKNWKERQKLIQPITHEVDIFMPSFYTYGSDIDSWKKMVKVAITQIREEDPSKPIFAFIWPQFYGARSKGRESYQGGFLPTKMWREELETLYPITDGVIIWTTGMGTTKFSTSMPWFRETLAFMKAHNIQ
jgi:hypothetical protein